MTFADPGPLPEIVTLAQAWRARRPFVDTARATGRPGNCHVALLILGASEARISMYADVYGGSLDWTPLEGAPDALEEVASMAEIAVKEEGTPDGTYWGRTTVDDVLAWSIVNGQLPIGPDGSTNSTYTGWGATRHGWAIAAAGVSVVDLARSDRPIGYEELAVMAALRDIRIPPLVAGEVFELPSGVYLEPVQEVMRFGEGSGRWWNRTRRLVGDPPADPPRPFRPTRKD